MDIIQLQQEREIVQKVEQFLHAYGPFISLAEAARVTGVPLPTLAEAVRTGRVPALRVQPRRWLVRVTALHNYFTNSAQNPLSEFEPIPVKGRPTSEILLEERH